MLIKNYCQLTKDKDKKILLEIAQAGIQAVLPSEIMPQILKYDKDKKILRVKNKPHRIKGRIFVIGGGKAVGKMAESLEKIIGAKNITAGVVNCVDNKYKTKKIKIKRASHPTPDINGLKGVKAMLDLRKKFMLNQNDTVICLISGGGSSLLPYPRPGITLKDKQLATKALVNSGADIQEINTVRKHLSLIKGGQLAEFFAPAQIISLIISDVIGNDLSTIASGITAPDKTTWQAAQKILKKYNLWQKMPQRLTKLIRAGVAGKINETPRALKNSYNYIMADNLVALRAMQNKARQNGWAVKTLSRRLEGETEQAAKKVAKKIIRQMDKKDKTIFILAGETTPRVPARHGQGGRNQHFALASAIIFSELKPNWPWTMASLASDGIDFIPQAAGAIVDQNSLKRAKAKKLNALTYLNNFDSYNFFNKLGQSLIKISHTGTNVGDLIVYLVDKNSKLK